MSYSYTEIIKDNILTAPRWLHHMLYACEALALFVGLQFIGMHLFYAAIVASLGLHFGIILAEIVFPNLANDPNQYSVFLQVMDHISDGCCRSLPLVFLLKILLGYTVALPVLGLIIVVYWFSHVYARP